MEQKFRNILLLSADEPSQLRPLDVDRVMDAAQDMGCLEEFRAWLLSQEDLQQRSWYNAMQYQPEGAES